MTNELMIIIDGWWEESKELKWTTNLLYEFEQPMIKTQCDDDPQITPTSERCYSGSF